MLSRIYEEHHKNARPEASSHNETLRKKAFESVAVVNSDLVKTLNSDVGDVFRNQRLLEEQTRKLKAQGKRFAKQTEQWLQVVDSFTKSLKELGDVDSWAQSIEWDMRQIVSSLEKLGTVRDIPQPSPVKEELEIKEEEEKKEEEKKEEEKKEEEKKEEEKKEEIKEEEPPVQQQPQLLEQNQEIEEEEEYKSLDEEDELPTHS